MFGRFKGELILPVESIIIEGRICIFCRHYIR